MRTRLPVGSSPGIPEGVAKPVAGVAIKESETASPLAHVQIVVPAVVKTRLCSKQGASGIPRSNDQGFLPTTGRHQESGIGGEELQ